MKNKNQDFGNFKELKTNFIDTTLLLVIFIISLGFLLDTAFF